MANSAPERPFNLQGRTNRRFIWVQQGFGGAVTENLASEAVGPMSGAGGKRVGVLPDLASYGAADPAGGWRPAKSSSWRIANASSRFKRRALIVARPTAVRAATRTPSQ